MGWSPTGLPLPIWNSPNDQRCRGEAVQACSVCATPHARGNTQTAGIKNTPMHVVRVVSLFFTRIPGSPAETLSSRTTIHNNPSHPFHSALPARIPETPSNISRNGIPQVFLIDVIITTASMQPNGGPSAPKLFPSMHEEEVGEGKEQQP